MWWSEAVFALVGTWPRDKGRKQGSGIKAPSPQSSSRGRGVNSAEAQIHGAEFAFEGIEDEAEDFQGYFAEEGIITGLAEDYGRMPLDAVEGDAAFGDVALDMGAIGQREGQAFHRLELQGSPNLRRQQGV